MGANHAVWNYCGQTTQALCISLSGDLLPPDALHLGPGCLPLVPRLREARCRRKLPCLLTVVVVQETGRDMKRLTEHTRCPCLDVSGSPIRGLNMVQKYPLVEFVRGSVSALGLSVASGANSNGGRKDKTQTP
jgi:hypothetical protein